MLRAFKTGDPNGNGIADEIPLELDFDNNRVACPTVPTVLSVCRYTMS